MYRCRLASWGHLPKNAADTYFKMTQLPAQLQLRFAGGFVVSHDVAFIIFESKPILNALKKTGITVLFIDGTFRITPKHFYQVSHIVVYKLLLNIGTYSKFSRGRQRPGGIATIS